MGRAGKATSGRTKLSVPGAGEDGQMLAELVDKKKDKIPDSITKAHLEFVKERKKVNAGPNLRKVLAKN